MKKILKGIVALFVVLVMSGCVKYNVDMKISKDGKMDMTFIAAVSNSMTEGATESTDEAAIEKLKNAGWKVEEYKDDTYTGSKLSRTFGSVDAISTTEEVLVDLNKFGQEGEFAEKLFQKTTKDGKTVYVAKFAFNLNNATGEDANEEAPADGEDAENAQQMEAMMQQMYSTMDLKFTVEVPTVVSNNATTVNENKLTWDLTKLQKGQNIEFSFSLPSGSSFPIIPIAIGVGVVAVIGIIVAVIVSKKKGASEPVAVIQDEPVAPVTPVAPVVPENATLAGPEVAPMAPTEPVAPVVPEVPVAPVEAPVEAPVVPETPVVPVEPVAPVTEIPEVPTDGVNTDNNNLL